MAVKKIPLIRGKFVLLPEEFTGGNLTTWSRRKRIPVLRRRLIRRNFSGNNPMLSRVKNSLKRRKLVFWREYIKQDGVLRRTKSPKNYKPMRRTKFN